MATPIAPTPTLDPESSVRFLDRVARNLKRRTKAVATPKINKTINSIMNDAVRKTKRNTQS